MISQRDVKIIKELEVLCQDENHKIISGAQLISAVVRKNTIISYGWNEMRTHPFQARFSKNPAAIFLHAEVSAIHKSLKRLSMKELKNSTLYVFRAKKSGAWGLAKPCLGCSRCITEFNISRVVYTTNEQELEEL